MTVFISLYYQKSFLYQNSVFLCLSHLLPLSTKYMLKVLQRRNIATVTVIKLFFLLFQNSSMYMHSSGTNHLVLTDYNPQLSSNGQIQNKSIQSAASRGFILVITLVIYLHAQNLRDINTFLKVDICIRQLWKKRQ